MAERSKALDWNSSKLFTGFRGFESHPLRQLNHLRRFRTATGFRQARQHDAPPPILVAAGLRRNLDTIKSVELVIAEFRDGYSLPVGERSAMSNVGYWATL